MEPLPRGTIGVWTCDESPPTKMSARDFSSYCHTVARQLGARVAAIDGPKTSHPRSFVAATLELPTRAISVLLNAYWPFVALAQPLSVGDFYPTFIDEVTVSDAFREFECYSVLSLDELNAPVTDEAIALLSEVEVREIRYWKPTKIGEVLFNAWD